jgi:hypothetical protein
MDSISASEWQYPNARNTFLPAAILWLQLSPLMERLVAARTLMGMENSM